MKAKMLTALWIFFLLGGLNSYGQEKLERQHRIKKSQFPTLQSDLMILGAKAKRFRYYKEVDSSKTTYTMKFKMDRLYYHLDYDKSGKLVNSGFRIQEVDIPDETFDSAEEYILQNFQKTKIRRIWQEYPTDDVKNEQEHLKNTFQNLMLAGNEYKFMVRGKRQGEKNDYELWFNVEGDLLRMRKSLPADHDRILY